MEEVLTEACWNGEWNVFSWGAEAPQKRTGNWGQEGRG